MIPTLDPELLQLALTHRSYAYENGNLPTNERLEFLGDSVLGVVITETLYVTHPDLSEGRLAKLRAAVVNARALADVARTIDLGQHIKLGKGEEATGGREKASILSDTVEALLGAVYLSGGFDQAAALVHLLFDPMLEAAAAMGAGLDWKTSLQELSATRELGVPEYVIQDEGPDHMKTFTARVRVADRLHGHGVGRSKKEAEQQAAESAYRTLSEELPAPLPEVEANGPQPGQVNGSPPRRAPRRAMPELPEVEVVRRGLEAHVLDHPIRSVEVLHPRPVRRHAGGPADFAARLTGRTFTSANRRGKYLWLALDDTDALLGHLGMSGQMLVQPAGVPDERHLRVRFTLTDDLELRFVDQRMFGGLAISDGGAVVPPEIAHIARDPLDGEFDDAAFVRRVRRSASGIKRLLLNQNIVSGVGNIYADEGLWLARVHGERPGSRLRKSDVERVLSGCRQVMLQALGEGGTSFDSLYVNVNGESGYFDRSLQVYGREAEPCSRCGTPIRRVHFMNRSSFFCPVCQPAPRRRRPATDQTPR